MPLFGNKDKREADGEPATNAEFFAAVERLEALTGVELAAEVMARGFGADGYLAGVLQGPHVGYGYVSARDIAEMIGPKDPGGRNLWLRPDPDLWLRLMCVIGEGLQALEHRSLIWASHTGDRYGVGYLPTRDGRAALENDAVDQALRGDGPEPT